MTKPRIYMCFDCENDLHLKHFLMGELKSPHAAIHAHTWSKQEIATHESWEDDTLAKIDQAHAVFVLLGENTRRSAQVRAEIDMAKALDKPILQLYLPMGEPPKPMADAGPMVAWGWGNIHHFLAQHDIAEVE